MKKPAASAAFKIRHLKPTDQKNLAAFFLTLSPETLNRWNRFGTHFTPKHAQAVAAAQIAKPLREEQGFVAYQGDRLAGYAYLRFFPEKPQKSGTASLGIIISDEFQSRGLGRRMMEVMEQYCRERKFKKIWLSTYSDNERTLPFYKGLGYIAEGIFMFDEFFGPKPRHVISMAKFLSPQMQKTARQLKQRFLPD